MNPIKGVEIIHKGERTGKSQKNIYILHTAEHYDCINSIKEFLHTDYFCHLCTLAYRIDSNKPHICEASCKTCTRTENCIPQDLSGYDIKCEYCKIKCNSVLCYELHLKHRCRLALTCVICNEKKKTYGIHVCLNQKYCSNCKIPVDLDHKCFIRTDQEKYETQNAKKQTRIIKIRNNRNNKNSSNNNTSNITQDNDEEEKSKGLIFYDYEAHVNSTGVHEANLVIASKKCIHCLNSVEANCYQKCKIYKFYDNDSFCEWLISKEHKGFTAIAHNFKGKPIFFIYFQSNLY